MPEVRAGPFALEQLEGQTLDGRFFIQRRLGAGNFGAVYLAEQRVFDVRLRPVALKLFRGEMVTQENAAEVLNDAIVLMQLQQEPVHAEAARHLVAVFDAGFLHERPGQAFILMEYVDGYHTPAGGTIRTLQGMIRAFRPVPVDLALQWMLQILKPLAWMHTLPRPVLHCDLKPDNILVYGKDTLKVADFGLAQLAFGIFGSSGAGGALTYVAPETLAGMYPTAAADVYSLGLILYEILAGENPLGKVGLEALAANANERFRELQLKARAEGLAPLTDYEHPDRPLGERLADHPLLLEIVDRCLRFKASQRYDNAAALLRAIEECAAGRGVVILPSEEEKEEEIPVTPSLVRLLVEAQVLLRQGRKVEARARCEQARRQFPQSGKPYRWLAGILLTENKWQEALQVCAEGRGVDPDEPELCDTAANAYDMGGLPHVATQMRKTAMRLREKSKR